MRPLCAAFLILFLSACTAHNDPGTMGSHGPSFMQTNLVTPNSMSVPLTKRQWIGKVAKILRYGHGLSQSDDLAQLENMSKEQIIDTFMKDERFGDTVLDFNLYFLGFKFDNLRKNLPNNGPMAYAPELYNYPAAIGAAKAVLNEGDFLSLLDYSHPFYMDTLTNPLNPNDPNLKPTETRATANAKILADTDKIIEDIKAGLPTGDHKVICKTWLSEGSPRTLSFLMGWPVDLTIAIDQSPTWFGEIANFCQQTTPQPPTPKLLENTLLLKEHLTKLIEILDPFIEEKYGHPKSLNDIHAFPAENLDIKPIATPVSFAVWRDDLTNSSTNQNRKRASYILKRFFCDDLTPLGVVQPAVGHGQGAHGTDPTCIACHFKLDPMAGFFRDRGIAGIDFSEIEEITFDDQFKIPRVDYEKLWKAPADAGHEWNVGYIRSLEYPEHNDYRSTLPELYELIRQAPEVRKCLVRRTFEYVNGENQVFDAGYLDELAAQFELASKTNSSKAFKSLLKTLLLNNTFEQTDISSNECYDYAPGVSPAGRPPCQVATIIEHNCKTCHDGAQEKNRLNFTEWKQMGAGYGFTDLDDKGIQIDPKQTFKGIVDRLSSTDPVLRMPLDKFMEDHDRVELVKWAEEMSK